MLDFQSMFRILKNLVPRVTQICALGNGSFSLLRRFLEAVFKAGPHLAVKIAGAYLPPCSKEDFVKC